MKKQEELLEDLDNFEEEAQKRYITLEDGMDFRTISKKMTAAGFHMNHATARNVYMTAMKKLFHNLTKELKVNNLSEEQLEEMLKEPNIHEAVSDLLYLADGFKTKTFSKKKVKQGKRELVNNEQPQRTSQKR